MATTRYPADFTGTPETDYLEIKMIRRDYKETGSTSYKLESPGNGLPDTIILNMPQRVTESISQNFLNASLGEIGPFLGAKDGTGGMKKQMVQNVIKRLLENAFLGAATQGAQKLGASQLNENGILSATSGVVYNPNLEVLYDGPDFRRFNFQFSLFTKSEKDAQAIYSIVRFFQYSSVPSGGGVVDTGALAGVILDQAAIETAENVAGFAGAGINDLIKRATTTTTSGTTSNPFQNSIDAGVNTLLGLVRGGSGAALAGGGVIGTGENRFIKQPPFLLLTYKRGANIHPFLRPLLPCSLNSLSIDYTPTGNYTVMDNFGKPNVSTVVAVNITLELTEVKNVFKEDYDNNFANRAIGIK